MDKYTRSDWEYHKNGIQPRSCEEDLPMCANNRLTNGLFS